ncbi:oligosaccharide flippase family protein [Sediminibacillus massiliensis]|uniref:oligosaccharide flippase family protein n=1 Tax=Sediminibacillus massiliensis TaxID=1926277 RepID=UPI0015C3CA33|nr:oligosaccharide flippase family protein [Sediminibacillus massiliensis]
MSIKNKRKNNRAVKDVSFLWISQLIAVFLGFVTQLIMARFFDVKEYGALSTALTLTTILGSFAALGAGQNWLRNFGKEGWQALRWVKPTININIIAIIVSIILGLIITLLTDISEMTKSFSILFFTIIISRGLSNIAEAVYQLEEKYSKLAVLKSLLHLFRFLSVVVVCLFDKSIYHVAIGYAISSILLTLVYCYLIRRMWKFEVNLKGHKEKDEALILQLNNKSIKSTFIYMIPFSAASLFYMVYFQGNVYIVNAVLGDIDSGIYYVAFSVMNVIYLFPTTFYQSYLIPKVHRWIGKDNSKISFIFNLGSRISILLGIIMMSFLAGLSTYAVPLLFGNKYTLSSMLLVLLSLTIPLRLLSNNMGSLLVTEKHVSKKAYYQGIGALFNIITTILFANYYGLYGVIIATLLTEALITMLFYIGVKNNVKEVKRTKNNKNFSYLMITLLSCSITILFFYLLYTFENNVMYSVVMLLVQLSLCFFIFKNVMKDFKLIKSKKG